MDQRFNRIIPLISRNDPIINSLNLSNIPLGDEMMQELTRSLNQNSFISKIVLKYNKLSPESCNLVFDLLFTNPKLTFLDISNNEVNDESLIHLSEVLKKLPPSREPIMLVLRQNKFTQIGAKALADALEHNVPVHWLDLRYDHHIGDEGVESIAYSLSNNTNLTGLDLIQCGCRERACSALSDVLIDNQTLTTILLQDKLDFQSINSLGQFLSDPSCALQSLYLWHCELNAELTEVLCRALQSNRSLSILALSYNHIDDHGGVFLADMIVRNTAIVKLQLGCNLLTAQSAGFFGVALAKNSTLKFLDLSRNQIFSYGVWPLAISLKDNHSLTSIDLRYNKIDQHGGEMLCELIEKNDSLQSIRLSGNSFGDSPISMLAEKLEHNTKLKEIEINEVQMTDVGFISLCKALQHNVALEKLTANGNFLNVSAMKAFADLLKENTSLLSISINKCNINDDCCPYIEKGIASNSTLKSLDLSKNHLTVEGVKCIADALFGNYTILQVEWQDEDFNDHDDEFTSLIADFLERNNYYQHNLLTKDMITLLVDPALI